MRLAVFILLAANGAYALFEFVPQWTAAREERRRSQSFQTAAGQAASRGLPFCPPDGPKRDEYLFQRQQKSPTAELWIPVCRISGAPQDGVLVVAMTRSELRQCSEQKEWLPSNVTCSLMEPLPYLANPQARHTWARREATAPEGDRLIWISARPMAWQNQLVAEHRERAALSLAILILGILILWSGYHTRWAFQSRAACHLPGEPETPPTAELLLHWLLGTDRSLAGDLSQEYALKLEEGWKRTKPIAGIAGRFFIRLRRL